VRILFSVHHSLSRDTGAPGATLELAEQLRDAGHEVSVYSWDDLPARLSPRARELSFGAFLCRRLLAARGPARPDVVDAMSGDGWPWCALPRPGRPALVSRAHGLEHRFYGQQLDEARRRGERLGVMTRAYHGHVRLWEVTQSLRGADLCAFLNEADRVFAVERLGVRAARTRIVANGVPQPLVDAGRALPGPDGARVGVAVVGSWAERKGIEYGAPALAALLGRHASLHALLLGTGVAADRVRARFAPAIRERVEVVPAYERSQLPELLRGWHINLFPTLAEGQSLALLETMACGLVPVTTPAGGEGVVHDGVDGLIVPARSSGALVDAVERLLFDRALLVRLRAAALSAAAGRTWAAAAVAAAELYAEAVALRARRA
jgi:glycosyltransferase involved in cell wall biosynthesis